jgi:hypothetical protein
VATPATVPHDRHHIDGLACIGAHLSGSGGRLGHAAGAGRLETMAGNYHAAIEADNASADTVQRQCFLGVLEICNKLLILLGERAGARTQDPVIKSHVLYRLSYALPWPLMAFKEIAIVFGHSRSMSCCHALLASRGKPAVLRIMLSARAV